MNLHPLLEKKRANEPIVTRFAPAPTGYLHAGHVASLLYVTGIARLFDAAVILRIEDHDRQRSRSLFETAILEDIAWLGIRPDFGDPSDFSSVSDYRQSDRLDIYPLFLSRLKRNYSVYRCDCTRKRLDALRGPGGEVRYDGRCRDRGIPETTESAVRIVIPGDEIAFDDLILGHAIQNPSAMFGDLLLKDRKGNWSYPFAVVVDDFLQGVNLVIRGEDLFESTAAQIILSRMIGRWDPPLFAHHPLLKDETGRKLSKRFYSESIAELRSDGALPEEVIGKVLYALGAIETPHPADLDEAYASLGLEKR